MNRNMKFGASMIGNYTVVKINTKIDDTNLNDLKEKYKDWLSISDNGKYGVRIEGVLPNSDATVFFGHDLRIAILQSKATKLLQEALDVKVRFNYPVETNICWTKANLEDI